MEIEGMIIKDLGLQEGISKAGNPWKKHEWVMETFGQYPRKVKFHVFGDRADNFNLVVGQSYVIQFDLESREFNDRWYTDVSAYNYRASENANQVNNQGPINQNVNVQSGQLNAPQGPSVQTATTFDGNNDFTQGNSEEDLPF